MTGLVPTLAMLVACATLPGCEGARPPATIAASPIPKTAPATPPRAADPTMDDVIAGMTDTGKLLKHIMRAYCMRVSARAALRPTLFSPTC